MPTLGSKEAIYSFAQIALGEKRHVAIPEPAYPVYERGTLFAGGSIAGVTLREDHGWLPDLDAFAAWDEIAIFWVCYPNNPDGRRGAALVLRGAGCARPRARLPALLRRGVLRALVRRAAGLGFAGRRPDERRRLQHALEALVDDGLPLRVHLRAAEIADALRTFRPTVGTAPQEFVQRASVAAWSDDAHVGDVRAIYRRKRETLLPALEAGGLRLAGSTATFYLWLDVGGPSEAFARRLLEHGVVCAPGIVLRPGRRGLRPLCPRADAGGVRARGGDRAGGPVTTEETIAALDRGEVRVAEPDGDDWIVNADVQAAILDVLPRAADEAARGRAVLLPRQDPAQDATTRSAACASCRPRSPRYGAFLSRGVVLMPSYVNIGAWVGPNTMVDTWATVGSGAQIGARRAPRRRRRHRRRARAAGRAAGDRRGRRVHRLALHRRRGRAHRARGGARRRTSR